MRVAVENVYTNSGLMVAELYPDREEGFLMGTGRLQIVRYAAKAPKTYFCLQPSGPGDYAVSVYQDENANTEFDKSFLGVPAEPWGLSNNPRFRLRPPRLDESLFSVDDAGADITIRLRH